MRKLPFVQAVLEEEGGGKREQQGANNWKDVKIEER